MAIIAKKIADGLQKKEQSRNTRTVRKITFMGENLCLTEWAERFKTTVSNLWSHIDRKGELEGMNYCYNKANPTQ